MRVDPERKGDSIRLPSRAHKRVVSVQATNMI